MITKPLVSTRRNAILEPRSPGGDLRIYARRVHFTWRRLRPVPSGATQTASRAQERLLGRRGIRRGPRTHRGMRMVWGLQNRLARIIRPTDGHTVMLAADHGYFLGPTRKIEIPRKTLEPLLPYADAVMVTRGVVRTSIDPGATVPIFLGAPHEHESLVNLGHLVDEGEEAGLPVLAVTAVGKELEKRDARYLGLATRIAAEFGAHFVKTYYCEPDFDKVVEGCPVPLVVAGGPKLETELDALELAYNSVQAGAAGVDMGRNIWQSSNPVGMIRAVRAVVHERATPKEALDVLKGGKARK